MTCLRQQQRTLIPLPRLCPPAAWPLAPTVSHSGSSCPRSFSHWIFKLCALLSLPGAVFQTQGSIYFFAKMGRQNHPALDRKKRKEIKLSQQTAKVVSLVGGTDFISTHWAHMLMTLVGSMETTTCDNCKGSYGLPVSAPDIFSPRRFILLSADSWSVCPTLTPSCSCQRLM